MTNKRNSVLYTGVTNDIERKVYEHKKKMIKGFTAKYNTDKLVYCSETDNISSAIQAEKQIKGWLRSKKVKLIESENPNGIDLSRGWFDDWGHSSCLPSGRRLAQNDRNRSE